MAPSKVAALRNLMMEILMKFSFTCPIFVYVFCRASADSSVMFYSNFPNEFDKWVLTCSVISTLLSSSAQIRQWSLGVLPHGSGLSYNAQGHGRMRKLVGVQRNKSSFLLYPSLFLWARTEGCHGDEVGPSPTAWSGKSSSLVWHLVSLQETETIKQGSTQTCPQRERREDEAFENGSGMKTDGLNNDTWKSWGLKHMENWLSLSLRKPFCFFLVSIHPQLLSLASF